MKKYLIILLVLLPIILLLFSNCYSYEEDKTIAEITLFGLTAIWKTITSATDDIIIKNSTLRNIKYIGYAVTSSEPTSWPDENSSDTTVTMIVTNSFPLVPTSPINLITLDLSGESSNNVWLRVQSGNDYMVTSCYYDNSTSSPNNAWELEVKVMNKPAE